MAGSQGQPGHHYQGNHIDGHARAHLGDNHIQNLIINEYGLTISKYKGSSEADPLQCRPFQIPKLLVEPTTPASTLIFLYIP